MPARTSVGFSLIEVIIAMTIMAMIALMLYWSFAMGARVWETQDLKTSTVQRQEALLRLLDGDFARISPYSLRWERGTTDFFAAGPTALFYVTRNGFASMHRDGKALFFTCLFIRESEDGMELAVYKSSVPAPELVEELHAFQTMSEFARAGYVPGAFILESAAVMLGGLDQAAFSYVPDPIEPFAGPSHPSSAETHRVEPLEEWAQPGLPGQVLLRYVLQDLETNLIVMPNSGVL